MSAREKRLRESVDNWHAAYVAERKRAEELVQERDEARKALRKVAQAHRLGMAHRIAREALADA